MKTAVERSLNSFEISSTYKLFPLGDVLGDTGDISSTGDVGDIYYMGAARDFRHVKPDPALTLRLS
jgi:hypothetical protein